MTAGTCADPATLEGLAWLGCYLSTGKHMMFYASFGTVLALLAITAPLALALGFLGALASRARLLPLRIIGKTYTAMVRGVPDIVFFLFVPIALDQGLEYLRHRIKCPDWTEPVRRGADFVVCPAAKLPLSSTPQIWHEAYGFALAVAAFAVVFGAFAANVLAGAMNAVPRAQLETAEAYGMTQRQITRRILIPQMWTYALPGLGNLWMILIKATPLLFLLGVEDIVYWARELGSAKTSAYSFPHPDWRVWYFLALLLFYLGMTKLSEVLISRMTASLARGQATLGGEARRKAAGA
ncbi:ABC transporter permease subunit [Phaeovulum vinaykumarii]|uniref:Amino acid ABC transporter membrane protein 1, PAAT family n=1 Tax=Phaeovulum vinaykumarii TaxID=407234 RepID=A0A1N7JJP7_9RHOB|nr:ABC transporter permease subunit [Phaeovulum vinaykumarii]SIS49592.1 amino acid ABC transporter membrane protein 1, PAAT family [Phaeovulum vinaykumarii]SOB89782.1 amino acid ABC transporter membrane protein 1 (PAAT family) [Phaeovulum vinaykumarii]